MYFSVKDIFRLNLLEGAKLAAGAKGLDNPVQWVTFMEILDALDSLQKGEMLVTTGYKLDDEERYKDFVMRLSSRGVCAAVIQTGYYIHKIPDYIIKDADRYGLPVIEIPAKLTFSHIMHALLDNITLKADGREDAEIINLKNIAVKLARRGGAQGLSKKEKAYLLLVSASASNAADVHSAFSKGLGRLKSYLTAIALPVEMESSNEKTLFYLRLKSGISLNDMICGLNILLTRISREDRVNLLIGAGSSMNPDNVSMTFDQALSAGRTLRNINAKKGVCHYDNIRFFEWFENFHKKTNALSSAYDILKPVISYDYFHKSEYFKTLKIYLANECKNSETSQKLFIHRHTLNNRIKKISELCSADLDDYVTKLNFSLAIMVYDYFMS